MEDLDDGRSRLSTLDVDEVALFRITSCIEAVNPYFELPAQVDPMEVSVDDLYHFASVMGPGHVEKVK